MNKTNQPKALYLLFAVKMWECFSFYGMRALMVLYLINQLGVEDYRAFGIYALYCALVEFGGIIGGRYADRLLGLRNSIIWGGWLIAAGHICLSLQTEVWTFFSGLALIVVGSGLFSTNISALLGLFYEEDDPRREAGFTLFYIGINIGALLASLFCGIIGEVYGWHYGFGLAAIGMIAGNILFISCEKLLEGKGEILGEPPRLRDKIIGYSFLIAALPLSAFMLAWENFFLTVMPCLSILGVLYLGRKMVQSGGFTKDKLVNLGLYLAALALFFAAEDQTASSMLVFSERFATKTIAGFPIPTTTLLSLNPFVIILGGFLITRLNIGKNGSLKLVVAGLLLASAVFASLTIACYFFNQQGVVPIAIVAVGILVISFGEVLLAPAIFSYCSEAGPKEWSGATMGLLPLGFSLGNVISGFLSKSMTAGENTSPAEAMNAYAQGFIYLSLLLFIMAAFIVFLQPLIRRLSNPIKEIS